jgi:hypothetical protein
MATPGRLMRQQFPLGSAHLGDSDCGPGIAPAKRPQAILREQQRPPPAALRVLVRQQHDRRPL